MLDLRFVRENPEVVKQNIRNKFQDAKLPLVDEVIELDEENRKVKNSMAPVACLEPGSTDCPRMGSCKTLPLWQGLDKVVNEYLDGVTIADLVQNGQPGDDYVI